MASAEQFKNHTELHHPELSRFERHITDFTPLIHLHGYDPTRKLVIEGTEIFDITGFGNPELNGHSHWGEFVNKRSIARFHTPIQQDGIQNPEALIESPYVSGHMFPTVRDWMKDNHPDMWKRHKRAIQEQTHAVIDPFIHVILPLQHPVVQDLLVQIGIQAFEQDYDISITDPGKSFGFWPGELAVDMQLANLLVRNNIDYLILDHHQLDISDDRTIAKIHTSEGDLYAVKYHHDLSRTFAFHDIPDAQQVVVDYLTHALTNKAMPLAAIDWETIGHHREMTLYAMNWLVHNGFTTLSPSHGRARDNIGSGTIKPTSWSCHHEHFGRWCGSGDCDCDGATNEQNLLKTSLYEGLRTHTDVAIESLGKPSDWQQDFVDWFLSQRDAITRGRSVSFSAVHPDFKRPFHQLFVGILGMTSCGWFFADREFERQIPVRSLQYLNATHSEALPTSATTTSSTSS